MWLAEMARLRFAWRPVSETLTRACAMDQGKLLIFGLGYTGTATARLALSDGWSVSGTKRQADSSALPGGEVLAFDDPAIAERLFSATHLLVTAAPDEAGDPVLVRWGEAIRGAPRLRWIGYYSSTGVYGDWDGAWVDEATPPRPAHARSQRRLEAEQAWEALADHHAVDIIRLAGIYGPGRSALDDVRAGRARRVIKPGHAFGRIHRDDIARATLVAASRAGAGVRILNFVDDCPAESAAVVEEAARLLHAPLPPSVLFKEAVATMSPMARSFWDDNRRVSCVATKAELGIDWLYPSFREGLNAILAAEGGAATEGNI
ncbi:Nucleoside-diphosphate-sugar epimerase [Granulibacter bethesdensis]|nr:Nucleoside-diphosphate-sugar epimerase [Granulibacter bethesdensis]